MYIVLTLQTYSSMYIVLTVIADLASLISFLGAHQISGQYLENISELGFFIYSLTKSTSFNIFLKFQRTWMWNVVFYNILNFQLCSSKNKVVVVFLKRPTFFGLKYYWSQNLQLVWELCYGHTHSNMYIVHTTHNHSNMYIVHHTIHTLNNMYIVLTLQTCSIMYIVLTIHTNSSMYIVHTKYTHSHRHSPVHQISTLHWN